MCDDFKIMLQSVPISAHIADHSKYEFLGGGRLWQSHSLGTILKIKLIEVAKLTGPCTKVYGPKSAVTG